jgi:predicted nuclease of predicted toxin-antitoxin system
VENRVRLLFDQNLSFKLCTRLAELFPGSTQARLLGLDRADDRTLWNHAARNGFVLVTQDADFAEMAALYGPPPKVVWLRGGNRPTEAMETTLRRNHVLILDFAYEKEATCLELY